MDLEKAIAKREQLKQKATELDAWVKRQSFQTTEDKDNPLAMPNYADFQGKMKLAVEEVWDAYFELDEKIRKVTAGLTIDL